MPSPCYSIILCEGFTDRNFWSGYFKEFGWVGDENYSPPDPFGKTHKGEGKYAFALKKTGSFVLIVPYKGKSFLDEKFAFYMTKIEGYLQKPDACDRYQIILNMDDDSEDGGVNLTLGEDKKRQLLHDWGKPVSDKCVIESIVWRTEHRGSIGVPQKQTLERLVCSAICTADPEKAQVVEDWIQDKDPKSYAWAYMSKWYAENGCDDFYQAVWRDEQIRPNLQEKLTAIGAWAIFESFQG